MLQGLVNTLRYYLTIVELAKLDDKELQHLNLNRSEIVHVAFKQYWKNNGLSSRAFH